MKVIAVANQKGGVGKSTTAHAIGAGLAYQGARVLFVDLDAQGNLTYVLGADVEKPGTYQLLMRQTEAGLTIQTVEGFDVIASSPALHAADMELVMTGKEYRLKEALDALMERYDYVVIDTPPALGTLTVNALTAADGVLIPAQADVFSLQGVGQLHQTIEVVRRYCNPNLIVLGILITRFSARSILSRDMAGMLEDTAKALGTKVYKAPIRETVALREAAAGRKDILRYAPRSNAAKDYQVIVTELIKQLGKPRKGGR